MIWMVMLGCGPFQKKSAPAAPTKGLLGFHLASLAGREAIEDLGALADLDRLVVLYRRLKLPFPPANAPLITIGGDESWGSHSYMGCGYLIKKLSHRKAYVWAGTVPHIVSDYRSTELEPGTPLSFQAKRVSPPFFVDADLALAIVERTRGHIGLALNSLAFAKVGTYPPSPFLQIPVAPMDATPSVRLRYMAAEHWINEIVDPKADRAYVFRQLSKLVETYPELKNPFMLQTLSGLSATIAPLKANRNEIERGIDALCRQEDPGYYVPEYDQRKPKKLNALGKLAAKGFDAVPDLIAHASDNRFTLMHFSGFANSPPALVTVGTLCRQLLSDYYPRGWETPRPRSNKTIEQVLQGSGNEHKRVCGPDN